MNSESSIMESHVSNSPGLDEYQIFIDGLRDGLFICSGSEMLACNKQLRSTSKGLAFLDDLKLRYKDLIHIYSYDIENRRMLSEEELSIHTRESLEQIREKLPKK